MFTSTGWHWVIDSEFCTVSYLFLDELLNKTCLDNVSITRDEIYAKQSAQWGMSPLQGPHSRFKDMFIFERGGEKRFILISIIRLLNLSTFNIGTNQLLTAFMEEICAEAKHPFSS